MKAALRIETVEQDLVLVCLTEDGFTSCCFVSSQHLAYEKERQLRAANLRLAAAALDPAAA